MNEAGQRKHEPVSSFHDKLTIDDDGIVLGLGTTIFRRSAAPSAHDAERTLCLLSILDNPRQPAHLLAAFERALKCWDRGDRSLAYIHLAHTRIGMIERSADAWRLRLAEALLDAGMAPRALAKELGFALPHLDKYDPDQPRNPTGSGRTSGQWTKAPSTATTTATASPPALTYTPTPLIAFAEVSSVVDAGLAAGALAFLAELAITAALPLAVFGLAMVLDPAHGPVASEGTMPGRPDLNYRLDPDGGRLTLSAVGDDDPTHALIAQLGPDGIYRDIVTGVAIARAVGDHAVLIDPDRAAPDTGAGNDDRQPKLCPAPKPDQPGGRKLFDILYEQYVRNTVNPQRQPQLPPQLTFALPGDTPSGLVHYDDCRESDGTMIDAKGNYAEFVEKPFGAGKLEQDWLKQAKQQIDASQGRRIEWYFNDASAAEVARNAFAKNGYDKTISVYHLPYPGGVIKPNPRIKR